MPPREICLDIISYNFKYTVNNSKKIVVSYGKFVKYIENFFRFFAFYGILNGFSFFCHTFSPPFAIFCEKEKIIADFIKIPGKISL